MSDLYIIDEKTGNRYSAYWITCVHCQKQKLIMTKLKNQRFCSLGCSSHARKKFEKMVCDFCQKEFISNAKQSLQRKNNKTSFVFCTRICKNHAQRTEHTFEGMKPKRYGHGAGNYLARARRLHENKCVDCGITDKELLVVHHKDSDRTNGNIDNLEFVCHNHHAIRHLKKKNGIWIYDSSSLTPREELEKLKDFFDK